MPQFLHTQADLNKALRKLAKADPRIADVLAQTGMPVLRRREEGLTGLARIICGQQLSTASAAAIWGRLETAFVPFDHDALRRARPPRLAKLGLSGAKIKTMKAIAQEIAKGRLDLAALGKGDADTAHTALVGVHGIGPWTADIYLLFCLGHADAWPAGDLAIQEGARMALGLKKRPDTKQTIALAEVWRPWRGAAAHLMWHYYGAVKKKVLFRPMGEDKDANKPAPPPAKRKISNGARRSEA